MFIFAVQYLERGIQEFRSIIVFIGLGIATKSMCDNEPQRLLDPVESIVGFVVHAIALFRADMLVQLLQLMGNITHRRGIRTIRPIGINADTNRH
jgi:hypothetical protein